MSSQSTRVVAAGTTTFAGPAYLSNNGGFSGNPVDNGAGDLSLTLVAGGVSEDDAIITAAIRGTTPGDCCIEHISATEKRLRTTSNDIQRGTATLVAGTVILVNFGPLQADSRIFLTRNTAGGVIGELSAPAAARAPGTPGTFTINSVNPLDTSDVDWTVISGGELEDLVTDVLVLQREVG